MKKKKNDDNEFKVDYESGIIDPYIYPDIYILKNILNIKDEEKLAGAEANYCANRIKQIIENPIKGNFEFEHFCKIHQYIFQDLYAWAGKPRVINMEKPEPPLANMSVEYSYYWNIRACSKSALEELNKIEWDKLQIVDKSKQFSYCMAEMWRVHPFREGNTRTSIIFFLQFAEEKNFPLDRKLLEENSTYVRTALVAASAIFRDLGDRRKPEYLERIILDAMERGQVQTKKNFR